MNNKNSLLAALLVTLASATTQSTNAKNIEVVIETPTGVEPSQAVKNSLTAQSTQSVGTISDATKASLENQKDTLKLEAALLDNVIDFVDACNKDAVAQNRKVTYTIENNKDTDTMTIKIKCKEEKPKAEYWESIKETVSSAATTVADKAKTAGTYVKEKAQAGAHVVADKAHDAGVYINDKAHDGAHVVADKAQTAGSFVKEKTQAGAHVVAEKAQVGASKVGDAAVTVKDKAKQGIHTAAEKIADITK